MSRAAAVASDARSPARAVCLRTRLITFFPLARDFRVACFRDATSLLNPQEAFGSSRPRDVPDGCRHPHRPTKDTAQRNHSQIIGTILPILGAQLWITSIVTQRTRFEGSNPRFDRSFDSVGPSIDVVSGFDVFGSEPHPARRLAHLPCPLGWSKLDALLLECALLPALRSLNETIGITELVALERNFRCSFKDFRPLFSVPPTPNGADLEGRHFHPG